MQNGVYISIFKIIICQRLLCNPILPQLGSVKNMYTVAESCPNVPRMRQSLAWSGRELSRWKYSETSVSRWPRRPASNTIRLCCSILLSLHRFLSEIIDMDWYNMFMGRCESDLRTLWHLFEGKYYAAWLFSNVPETIAGEIRERPRHPKQHAKRTVF